MGCVITITDDPAMRASERDLLALVPRGKAPAGAGDTAVAHTKGQGSSSAVTRWVLSLRVHRVGCCTNPRWLWEGLGSFLSVKCTFPSRPSQ